jgi:copper(I)-binding protein
MNRHAHRARGIAHCLGVVLALIVTDANAIFIVNQPWLTPAAKGRSTAAYMDLTSTEGATLVAARSDAAVNVRIAGSKGRAAIVASLPLPAGKMIRLEKGGYRLVLDRLTRTVALGDRVILTLTIEAGDGSRQEIAVNAEARRNSPLDDERRAHHHGTAPH